VENCDNFPEGKMKKVPEFYEPSRERGDNFFRRCVLIGGMCEIINADWWDAGLTSQWTPLSL